MSALPINTIMSLIVRLQCMLNKTIVRLHYKKVALLAIKPLLSNLITARAGPGLILQLAFEQHLVYFICLDDKFILAAAFRVSSRPD